MTTIAYHHKDKQIAVDSRSSANGLIVNDQSDKTRRNDKGLWILCGKNCDFHLLMELQHNQKVDVNPACTAYLINDDTVSLVVMSGNGYCEILKIDYNHSMGSGGDFALAAMDHGKTAKQAVEYAMTRDIYTGGKVHVIDVETGNVI